MAFNSQSIVHLNGYDSNHLMRLNETSNESQKIEKSISNTESVVVYKHIQPAVPCVVLRKSLQSHDAESQQRFTNLANQNINNNNNNLFPLHLDLLLQQQQQQQQRNLPLNSLCEQSQFSAGINWFNNVETHDYQYDFLNHLRQREALFGLSPYYLQHQHEIDYTARTYLIDWLVLVTREQNFDTETLYLAVAYVDRFLSLVIFPRCKLQLVGATAIYIAAKYEETRLSGIRKFGFIGGIQFNTEQIVKLEKFILKTLNFDLHIPTAYCFVDTYAMLIEMPHLLKFLTLYLCELSLLEAEPYVMFKPSLISAAAHCLARYLLGFQIWSLELENLTTYRLVDLKPAFLCLCQTHIASITILPGAIQMKYTEEKFHQVASIPPVVVTEDLFEHFVLKYYGFL